MPETRSATIKRLLSLAPSDMKNSDQNRSHGGPPRSQPDDGSKLGTVSSDCTAECSYTGDHTDTKFGLQGGPSETSAAADSESELLSAEDRRKLVITESSGKTTIRTGDVGGNAQFDNFTREISTLNAQLRDQQKTIKELTARINSLGNTQEAYSTNHAARNILFTDFSKPVKNRDDFEHVRFSAKTSENKQNTVSPSNFHTKQNESNSVFFPFSYEFRKADD